jgi:hypothetical protein
MTMIKLQPGYHCLRCPCFDNEYFFCNVKGDYVKRDYNSSLEPAMPLAECPVDCIVLSNEDGEGDDEDLRQPQIMGIFNEAEYDQWLDQGGNDAS